MAQAPTAEQTVFPEQGPLPNAGGADFGAQVGAATQGLGEQISQAGDTAAKIALQWQGYKNQATAQDLDVQFQGDLGQLEDNFYTLKGKAAADAYPQFQSDVEALRSKYLGAVPNNPEVQQMLGQSVGYSVGRSLRSAGQQAGEQTRAWMVDSGVSRVQTLDYNATKRFNDQGLADETDTARDAAIEDLGKIQGWSPEHIALAKQESRDKLLADRQAAAQTYIKGQPVADVMHSLVGTSGAGSQNGPVGGDAYRKAVVATEFGSGQNNPDNPHQGPVQADDAWWAHFGAGGDRNNMQDALKALDRETAENTPKLKDALGRPVTDADLYLAHQQGLQGAIALLKNPGAPASQSVPVANIAANLPAGSPDASTITGQQFSDIWAKGFDQSGGVMANNTASRNNQLDSAVAVLTDAQKMELTKSTIEAWHTQDTAYREQTNFQQEQQAKAAKQQYDQVLNAGKGALAANWADPQKNPAFDVAKFSQTPYAQQHPEIVTDLLNYRKALATEPDKGVDKQTTATLYRGYLNGTATTQDFQDAFAPKDGSPGTISKENLDFLMNAAKGKDDPTAESTKALKAKFISDNDTALGKGETIDPDSEYRFNFDLENAWQAKVAKGENPKDLITPGNKDYFGSLANLAHYSQTAKEALDQETAAQNEIDHPGLWARIKTALQTGKGIEPTQPGVSPPAQPAEYKTMADIQGAINRHEISLADAKKYAIDHGIGRVVPKTAAESGPVVPND